MEPHPLGDSAHGQGDLRSADRLPLPVPRAGRDGTNRRGSGHGCPHPRRVDAFLDQLGSVDLLPLALAIGCHLLKMACTSRAWRNVLAAAYPEERVPWISIYGAYLAGVGINAIIPARAGDAVRIVLAHRAIPGSTYTTVVSSTLVLSFFDMFAASLFLAWAVSTRRASGPRRAGSRSRASTSPGSSRDRCSSTSRSRRRSSSSASSAFWIAGHVADFRERVRAGVPRDVAADALPGPRRALAGGRLGAAHRHHLVHARRVRHPADAGERRPRPGVVERRHALPDHACGCRHGAGVPALRAERRGRGLRAPRLQCRRKAHAHAHERRRRIHGDRADAAHGPLSEGARAVAAETAETARTGRPCGAARRGRAPSSAEGRERPRAPPATPRGSARRSRSAG